MILYASVGICLFLLAFLRMLGPIEKRLERPLVLCITILAFAFSWMRWKTGTDWADYVAFFRLMTAVSVAHSQDWWGPAYAYIAVFVNSLGGGYTEFLCLLAAVQYAALYFFLTRSSAAPLVALFVLFCGNFYGIYFVREDIAVVFFLGFAYYYYQKSYLAAAVMGSAAIAFHISAVIPICLLIFIVRFSWKKFFIGVAGGVVGAYFVFKDLAWSALIKVLPVLGYFGSSFVEVKETGFSTTTRAYIKLAFLGMILLMARFRFQDRVHAGIHWEWYDFCRRSALAIIVLTACFLPLSQIVARFTMYAMPLIAVLLSNYEFRLSRISLDGAVYVAVLLLFFVELDALYSGYAHMFYPVKTILTR